MSFWARLAIGLVSGASAAFFGWLVLTGPWPWPPAAYGGLALAVFCGVVTLACFHAKSRPVTLRLIGASMLALLTGMTIYGLAARDFKLLGPGAAALVATGRIWWLLLRYGGSLPSGIAPVEEPEWTAASGESEGEEEFEEW